MYLQLFASDASLGLMYDWNVYQAHTRTLRGTCWSRCKNVDPAVADVGAVLTSASMPETQSDRICADTVTKLHAYEWHRSAQSAVTRRTGALEVTAA
jgi:hypothetical protein